MWNSGFVPLLSFSSQVYANPAPRPAPLGSAGRRLGRPARRRGRWTQRRRLTPPRSVRRSGRCQHQTASPRPSATRFVTDGSVPTPPWVTLVDCSRAVPTARWTLPRGSECTIGACLHGAHPAFHRSRRTRRSWSVVVVASRRSWVEVCPADGGTRGLPQLNGYLITQNSLPKGSCITAHSSIGSLSVG